MGSGKIFMAELLVKKSIERGGKKAL